MKIFYIDAFIPRVLFIDYPLIAACYPNRLPLKAKTKKAAIAEAGRIQKKQDAIALEIIEQLKQEGYDYEVGFYYAPNYKQSVFFVDTEEGAHWRI